MLDDHFIKLSCLDVNLEDINNNESLLFKSRSKTPSLFHNRDSSFVKLRQKHIRKNKDSKSFVPKSYNDINHVIEFLSTKSPE